MTDKFEYSDKPEAYDQAMETLYDENSDELGEEYFQELSEEEQQQVAGMVEMNDIIGQQAGGLAGMQDLSDADEYLEASDD